MPIELILTISVILAGFYMAWNIGANDVSNAMGTSVGSGALTLFKAVIIAGILEFCGAFFLGESVSKTVQEGIINSDSFSHNPKILFYGMLSALIATALWLQVASYFGWPVSTTHAIIGALLGFGALIGGLDAIHWSEMGAIALSWIITPAISGLFAFLIFTMIQRTILFTMNPILASKKLLPIFTLIVVVVFTLTTLSHGLGSFHVALTPLKVLSITLGIGLLGMLGSILLIKKIKLPSIQYQTATSNNAQQIFSLNKSLKHLYRVKLRATGTEREAIRKIIKEVEAQVKALSDQVSIQPQTSDYEIVEKMFASLQILSAAYVAFAHGANDVANAIGPVAGAMQILKTGAINIEANIPTWLLAMGGIGIVIGLATWGWRVMETIGKKITELTPTRGFSAEFGAAVTILLASKLGLPISTTHCIVGAVLGVGLARGISALNLRVLRDIILSWIITIPASAIVCILIYYIIHAIFS